MGKLKQMSAKIKKKWQWSNFIFVFCRYRFIYEMTLEIQPENRWKFSIEEIRYEQRSNHKFVNFPPTLASNARTKYFQLTTEPLEWNFISMKPFVDRSFLDPIFFVVNEIGR